MVGKARMPEKAQTVDMAELEAKHKLLSAQLAEITRQQDEIKAQGRQAAIQLIADKTVQLQTLYSECKQLAQMYDVDFKFQYGYDEFNFNPDESWNSSNCY